jgi:hypothetical protein
MPYPDKFPQFSKLPQDVRDDILRRSVRGARVNFVTVKKTNGHGRSSASLTYSRSDADGAWGGFSTRTRLQETAAVNSEGYNTVMHFLRNWVFNPADPDPLMVLVPQQQDAGHDDLDMIPRSHPTTINGEYWDLAP